MKRVALVTGSTRGIEREVARQLAARGDDVIVVGSRDVDVGDEASVANLGEKVEREYGRLDVLMTQRFAPLLRKSGHGRVVNVSSGAGQLSSMTSYAPANATRNDGVLVNCADPGWVCTDMGGPTAGFFHDRKKIAW